MHNLKANFKLESAMNLVFESFGAISSWMWTVSDNRLLSDNPWSLSRVTGKNPVPEKHWYIFTSSLCGVKPNKFAKNEIFRRFPQEIRSVPPADLKPAKRGWSSTCSQPNSFLSLRLVFSLHYFDSEILPPMGSWDRLNLLLL